MPTNPSSDRPVDRDARLAPALSDTGRAHAVPSGAGEPAPVLVLAPGSRPLPEYELVRQLGRGGFGEVWQARGPSGFDVALKFIRLGDKAGRVEVRALEVMKGVRHAHLLCLFGAWQVGELLVVAMELADGSLYDRLNEALQQGQPGIPREELLEALREAAKGLDHLNGLDIQHRDVKPHNLLLVGGSVKVADFGLAKVMEHTVMAATSNSMTVAYAAPEFLKGEATRWSDQYCLAVSYCQLRGGRLPFEGNPIQVMAGHALNAPDLSMLPEAERTAVARALRKEPEQRWPSCRAFAEALAAGPNVVPPAFLPREAGEVLLAQRYEATLERTQGKLTAADKLALARLCRAHGISEAQAQSITRAVRTRWKEARSGQAPSETANLPVVAVSRPPAQTLAGSWAHSLLWLPLAAVLLVGVVLVVVRLSRPSALPGDQAQQSVVAPAPRPQEGQPITNSLGMRFVWIRPGRFQMGSPGNEPARDKDETQHEVTLTRGYHLGVHLVTQWQWEQVMGADANRSTFKGKDDAEKKKLPVDNVSWDDCQEFCRKLGTREGRKYRLPTEAEWEYACRAGTTTPFWWGGSITTDQANYDGNYTYVPGGKTGEYRQKTTPVDFFKPNPWGLYDMHGNLYQWCEDGFESYPEGDIKDPVGKNSDARVLRGGSWSTYPRWCRAAGRFRYARSRRDGDVGCRVVCCLD